MYAKKPRALPLVAFCIALAVCPSIACADATAFEPSPEKKPASFHVCVLRDSYLHKTPADFATQIPVSLAKSINTHFSWDAKRAILDGPDDGTNWHGLRPFCSDLPIANEEMTLFYEPVTTHLHIALSGYSSQTYNAPLGRGFMIHVFGVQFSGSPL